MAWLNYHHLLYFWTVARRGSIARACEELHLTQPAVSAQLRTLERALGERLFERRGRQLVLTDVGRVVYRYADEIFTLGRELQETLAGRPTGRPQRLVVGVSDALPKLLAVRLLEPALQGDAPVRLVVRDDKAERLLAELALHEVDVVLADAPSAAAAPVRAYSHLLGESGVTIFGAPALATRLRRRFPRSLDGAPFLLPAPGAALRRSLDQWLAARDLHPSTVAEIDDSAVLEELAQAGLGCFAAPTVVEREVQRRHGVRVVGRIPELKERYYAISVERKLKHPAVVALQARAREELFGAG